MFRFGSSDFIKISVLSLLLLLAFNTGNTEAALFDGCDNTYNLNAGTSYLQSPYYPNNYPAGTSCRYRFIAPLDYQIQISCDIKLTTSGGSCANEYFYVARDGDAQLRGSEQFCGTGKVTRTSVFRIVTLAYISYSTQAPTGNFNCRFDVTPQGCDCGWSVNTKIVSGQDAGKNEYPSMVSLKDLTTNLATFCGASIISHRALLTAAHCTRQQPVASYIRAYVGDHDLSSATETQYAASYAISQIIEHPGYKSDPTANDIAILKLSTDIEWSRGVGPICLPPQNADTYAYNYVDVIGWGSLSFGGLTATKLQKVQLLIPENTACAQSYQGIAPITSSQICTYDYEGKRQDSCQYDSGGPVILRKSRQFLLGIISFGKICGQDDYAMGVNTRISSYLTWIYNNIGSSTCSAPLS